MPEIDCNGLRVHYQRAGQGGPDAPTVVMIHGLVIDNLSSLYYALAPGVVETMNVVLYDLRGHGRTERPAGGYGLLQAVQDLWDLLDTLEITEPVFLLGNSYGGTIALEAARRNPERVRGLVLVEAHVAMPGWGTHIADQLELAGFGLGEIDLEEWLTTKPPRKLQTLRSTVDGLVNHTSVVEDFRSGPVMRPEDLKQIECPAYAVYGEYSDVIDRADHLASLLPRMELDVLSDCSHSAMMEATKTMRSLIADWFTRVVAGQDVPGRRRMVSPGEGEGDGAENKKHVDSFIETLNRRREKARLHAAELAAANRSADQ